MKIVLLRDTYLATRDGRVDTFKTGQTVSVAHYIGRRLLMGRSAKWMCSEPGDPFWEPVETFRAAIPERDKMIRTAANK